jgi:hypothetical protein
MPHWQHLNNNNTSSGTISHDWNGASLKITDKTGALIAELEDGVDFYEYLGEILGAADDRAEGRMPQTVFRRILNRTGWDENSAKVTTTYPHADGGVQVTGNGISFGTGEPRAYCHTVLSLCEMSVGEFQKA